jgi:hypothetical protein
MSFRSRDIRTAGEKHFGGSKRIISGGAWFSALRDDELGQESGGHCLNDAAKNPSTEANHGAERR